MLQGSKPLQSYQGAPPDPKAELITGYVEKYATIAGKGMTADLYEIYVYALSGFEIERIQKGLDAYLKQGTSFPWPGTLVEWVEAEI